MSSTREQDAQGSEPSTVSSRQQTESDVHIEKPVGVPEEAGSPSKTQPAAPSQAESHLSTEQPAAMVYKEGKIQYPSEETLSELFELPDGIDAEAFYFWSEFLTMGIKGPLESMDQMDEVTAHFFVRNMLEYYRFRKFPGGLLDAPIIYRTDSEGRVDSYTSIPVSDFLDFTTRRFGLDDIQFFQAAIPPEDTVVRFELDQNQILVVPATEWYSSDFKTGHIEIQDSVMTF
ncbi:hypothetical protein EVA_09930, partial [gut metagenome]